MQRRDDQQLLDVLRDATPDLDTLREACENGIIIQLCDYFASQEAYGRVALTWQQDGHLLCEYTNGRGALCRAQFVAENLRRWD